MYGIQPIPELQYITETPHKMTRLRAMLDFVNHNNMNSVSDLYNANKTIIDQNYDFVTSGDFFEFNMNRIDQYVTKV